MRGRRFIIIIALLGLVTGCAALTAAAGQRRSMLMETGETRRSIEQAMSRLLPATAESARDPSLLAGGERLSSERYVAALWVVDRAGEIVLHKRGPGKQGENVRSRGDMPRLFEAVEAGEVPLPLRLELLAVGAMRSEGDHNDVFRHAARAVTNLSGELTGVVALAYDVNPGVGGTSRMAVVVPVLISLAGFAAYWFGVPLWVYLDAGDRAAPRAVPVLWALFVLATNVVGLAAYVLAVRTLTPSPHRT